MTHQHTFKCTGMQHMPSQENLQGTAVMESCCCAGSATHHRVRCQIWRWRCSARGPGRCSRAGSTRLTMPSASPTLQAALVCMPAPAGCQLRFGASVPRLLQTATLRLCMHASPEAGSSPVLLVMG